MTGKYIPKEMISPVEAMKLFQYASIAEMLRAKALYATYRRCEEGNVNPLVDTMTLLAFVYDTGRVQGIREERAKCK